MIGRLASRYPEQHPRCFMHVPGCGGISVHRALLAALPAASVNRQRMDTSHICCAFTAFDELEPDIRQLVLVEEDELGAIAGLDLVSGNFCLPTLLRVAPPDAIATIVREPRARLLSHYAHLRLTVGDDEAWHPYHPRIHALRPLDEFLSEPLVAPATDNALCRMLLYGDPRVPAFDFIRTEHVEDIALDAIDWLEQLGFVGVLECTHTIWEGLSRFFGATLLPTCDNVTASLVPPPDYVAVQEPISTRTLDLLKARNAADALVYMHVLGAGVGETEAKRICDDRFAAQLVRFGNDVGSSAASARSLSRRLAEAESQLAGLAEQVSNRRQQLNAQRQALSRLEDELARHRMWLEGIQGSASWRMTRPLRAAKRRVLGSKRMM